LYTTIKYIFATNETMFATFAILGTMKFFTWLRGYHNGKEPFLSQLLRLCLVIVFEFANSLQNANSVREISEPSIDHEQP
jgi:hypothetical protein